MLIFLINDATKPVKNELTGYKMPFKPSSKVHLYCLYTDEQTKNKLTFLLN